MREVLTYMRLHLAACLIGQPVRYHGMDVLTGLGMTEQLLAADGGMHVVQLCGNVEEELTGGVNRCLVGLRVLTQNDVEGLVEKDEVELKKHLRIRLLLFFSRERRGEDAGKLPTEGGKVTASPVIAVHFQ